MDLASVASLSTPGVPDLGNASAPAKPGKLHQAAQQFEALLVGEMMKSVREDGQDGWLGSGDDTGDSSAMDMAESQFANALAQNGGLGLTHVIEERMSQGSQPSSSSDTPVTHSH
jgi:flagellar protein FlgJ